jgi:hypothetical protein
MGAPALLDAQASQILAILNAVSAWHYNHVDGMFITNNGTAISSSIATIAVNVTAGVATGNGSSAFLAAASGSSLAATKTFTATSGKSAIAAIIVDWSSSAALKAVWGAEAATGAQVAPTDAEITASVGHENWARCANFTATITSSSAGTYSVDNTARASVVAFAEALSVTDAEFRVPSLTFPAPT